MDNIFKINKNLRTPVYQQLMDSIITGIENRNISEGDQLPSINQIAKEQKLARETIVKAFKLLQQKGIIKAVHGKGYFISSSQINIQHRVFILLDTLSAYKEVMYNAIQKTFGKEAYLDVYFHHYNPQVFQKLVEDAAGNYTSYIILPFDKKGILDTLKLLPEDKMYIIDQKPEFIAQQFSGVFQDFKNDTYSALTELRERLSNYNKFTLLFRNSSTQLPKELKQGFEAFCKEIEIYYNILESDEEYIPVKGEAFLVIDDDDLVFLIEHAMAQNWRVGQDIGILSYNETSLKKVVAGGISVISTNFAEMGKTVVEMIKQSDHQLIANPCRIIDRRSL